MKKLFALLTAALCGLGLFVTAACTATPTGTYSVYAPDGAPALALAKGIAENSEHFNYHVVDAKSIEGYVTGETPAADFCVLPVNTASLQLGDGSVYQMLGTVTNGNMYFMTTQANGDLTADNLSASLVGKTVGVVQLPNVPGLALRAMLQDRGIAYTVISSTEEKVADKVNLIAFMPENVAPAGGCDYYLCPEPVASLKEKNANGALRIAGDLQALYGDGQGYPQAVLVAKKSVIQTDRGAIDTMLSYMREAKGYLESAEASSVVALLDGVRTAGLKPSFTVQNLTKEVIGRCSVRFTASRDCKTSVNAFLTKVKGIDANKAGTLADGFFYGV